MSINETQSQLNKAAAQNDPSLCFTKVDCITGISAKHIDKAHDINMDLFNRALVSAGNLKEVMGLALLGTVGTGIATSSPLAAGLIGTGLAFNAVFSGNKKTGREV
jgi:hypothetical protein